MKHADPVQLRTVIARVITESQLAEHFQHLTLEASDNDDAFLRVVVRMSDLDAIGDDAIDGLTSSIETAVGPWDDRFPSVRYAEP